MKHFILATSVAASLASVVKGAVGAFELGDNPSVASSALTKDFSIFVGDGTRNFVIDEVNFASLKVTKAAAADAVASANFAATVTIATATAGKEYTIRIFKKGVEFNRRNSWTFNYVAKSGDTVTTIAAALAKLITENGDGGVDGNTLGLKASNSSGVITIQARTSDVHDDYVITCLDYIDGVAPSYTTHGAVGTNDEVAVRDLMLKSIQNRGYNYTFEGGSDLNKFIEDEIPSGTYTIYTLNFRNPRVNPTIGDDDNWQYIHIATKIDAVITRLDTLFGTGTAQSAGGSGTE